MRTSKTLAVFAGACLLCGCVSPYEAGRRDAQKDISRGCLAVEAFGSPRDSYREYERLLQGKYDISVRWVATNNVSSRTLEHWKGYNEVATVAIELKYGKDFFRHAQAEARASYEQKNQSHE